MPVAILPIERPAYEGFVPRRLVSPEPATDGRGDEDDYIEFPDPRLVYTEESGPQPQLLRLNTLRRDRESTDLVLFVAEREIMAHQSVAAAFSPLLAELIAAGAGAEAAESLAMDGVAMEESKPRTRPLYLEFPNLDYDAFDALINYAYTAKLEIVASKVGEVYRAAGQLGVGSAAAAAGAYLAESLSPTNAIRIRRYANRSSDAALAAHVDAYISKNFPDIIHHSPEFTALPTLQVEVISEAESVEEKPSELAGKVLAYFQALPQPPDHRDARLHYLTQASHMLYLDESWGLRDCRDIEDSVSVASSDLVVDYKVKKRSEGGGGMLISPPLPPNPSLLNTPHWPSAQRNKSGESSKASPPSPEGGVPTIGSCNLNLASLGGGKTGLSSSESLNSLGSSLGALSSEADEMGWEVVAVAKVSESFVIALALMHHRLMALSIQIINPAKRVLRGTDETETSPPGTPAEAAEVATAALPTLGAPRCGHALVKVAGRLLAAGGYDRGECLASAEELCGLGESWRPLSLMREERGRFDAVGVEGKVWALGGSSGLKDLSSVEIYDPATEIWSSGPPMLYPKSNHGAAALANRLFCVGGWNGQVGIKEVEVLDLGEANPKWSLGPSLSTGRYQAGCTAVAGVGVVAVGGCEHWGCLSSVELLREGGSSWLPLAPLSVGRRGCGVAEWRGFLWAVGGSDGARSLASVERLRLGPGGEGGAWEAGPSLTTPRANVRVAVFNDCLVAVGGFSGQSFLPTMEILSNETGEWETVFTKVAK